MGQRSLEVCDLYPNSRKKKEFLVLKGRTTSFPPEGLPVINPLGKCNTRRAMVPCADSHAGCPPVPVQRARLSQRKLSRQKLIPRIYRLIASHADETPR